MAFVYRSNRGPRERSPLLARVLAGSLVVLGASLVATTTASTTGCTTDAGTTPTPVCPPGQTCSVNLTLLHTADIHSRLFDYDLLIEQTDAELGLGTEGETKTVGGIARVSYVINRERARSDRVLHLDSGDIWQGAPIFNFFHGEPEVRAESQIFPDAMVIGNHEYDDGALNVATEFQRWADFPILGANYSPYGASNPLSTRMETLLKPFEVFNQQGLKIAVIGMGNLSTLGSLFNQPNPLGMYPLDTVETSQGYVDLLRPYVDFIIILSHLGLDVDQEMVTGTTGIDIVLGGHNHIVINPPQHLQDCSADPQNTGYVWAVDPNVPYNPNAVPPPYDCSQDPTCNTWQCTSACKDPSKWVALPDPSYHPYEFQRACVPRTVIIEHSGAFAKYVGRDDLILSNDPAQASPTGNPKDYDPNNGFEIISNQYQAFPIDTTIPEDPVMVDLLQPYERYLDDYAGLDILLGFSPNGASRTAPQGGDAPLGNLVAASMWLRFGVQTDFSLTNTTGMRTDLDPGPVTLEEMFNIFPFNNSITKMQLSGLEVEELFDYVARRSQGRGCISQAQIAGARVRLDCAGCTRPDAEGPCVTDEDCIGGVPQSCVNGQCNVTACADQIFIGNTGCTVDADCGFHVPKGICQPNAYGGVCQCQQDSDCGTPVIPGICDIEPNSATGTCSSPIALENLYSLATIDYLAAGGSGFVVLKDNTTQQPTYIQQRDAIDDYLREGKPCGYSAGADGPNGLQACANDNDCNTGGLTGYVCACSGGSQGVTTGGVSSCHTSSAGCAGATGECVLQTCRDQVAQFTETVCASSPNMQGCLNDLNACSTAGEECKFLSCIDQTIGNFTDNRVEMIGR
jgi:5'-nucleotidase